MSEKNTGRKHLLYKMFPPIIARVLVGGSSDPGTAVKRLLSSDGYTLTDASALYLIPKEG